jgi:signal transduction histidine kinase
MHLKIWHKMIIGIAIPSCIAILGGILTYGYINDVKNRQDYVQIADDLKEHVLETRRIEKNFLHFKNEDLREQLKKAISLLTDLLYSISPETAREIGEEDISFITSSIQEYDSFIKGLFNNYLLETRITDTVRTEGRKLETFAEREELAPELSQSFILNLRRLEKNYMLFRDDQAFSQLYEGLAHLKNVMPFCIKCTPYIEAVHSLSDTYKKSAEMENELQVTGKNLEEITGTIAVRERERISSFITQTKQILLIVLILLCTLGPFFVYKTATYIVAPIKRLAEITKKISEGDMQLRAPLREHDETYSLAQSFNTMLNNLQQTHKSLEHSIDLLHEKQVQLVESEKRASIGLLVSGVAHELNNPLNNISLTAETMIEDLEELPQDDLKSYVNDIFSQCERAQNIVVNLLDFARARRSTGMEDQDIVTVVQDSISLIANQLRVNKISLKKDIPDGGLYVRGNRSKLEQIFISIMTNAIQAMEEEGTLTVIVQPDEGNRNVLIKISDTGPGIPEEELKNIFEPFFTTKAVGKGTGLGLSVSRSLVMEHKGEIEVESRPGEGTTFTIKLPQSQTNE